MLNSSVRLRLPACLFALVWFATVGQSADLHSYLPGDAKVVMLVNARLLLDSPLLVDRDKTITYKTLLEARFKTPQVLGIKPLEHINTALVALPSAGEVRKVFVVLKGKFDPAAIRQTVVQSFKDSVKDHGSGPQAFQEFRIPVESFQGIRTPAEVFLAVPDETTCLISLGDKDDLAGALAQKNKGTPAELRQLLEKNHKEAAVSGAMLSELAGPFAKWKDIRRAFGLFQGVHGWMRMEEEPHGQTVLVCPTPESARELSDLLQKGLNGLTGILALLSRANKDLVVPVDVLRTVRVRTEGTQITIRGKLDRDSLEDAIRRQK